MNASHLLGLLESRLDSTAREWLSRAGTATSGNGLDDSALLEAFSLAGRRLGQKPLEATGDTLAGLGLSLAPDTLTPALLRRMALLLRAQARLEPERYEALVAACYRSGDNAERQAVLKALPLLDRPERFLELARDACRTHVQPVFEAIACENPYPAAYFSEPAFNQLALKAVFTGVPLARVVGLERRRNPELARMAADYASERKAAGRGIPDDLTLLLPPGAST
jgi:hypothetical protein